MKTYKDILIEKYLKGIIDPEEAQELSKELQDEKEKFQFLEKSNSWQGQGRWVDDNWHELTMKMERYIKLDKVFSRPKRRLSRVLQYAAAIFIALIIGAGSMWFAHEYFSGAVLDAQVVFETPRGEKSKVTLADGTSVWLNSGSKLRYSHSYGDNKRQVVLTGEGYFDVRKGDVPFVVKTGSAEILVFGTRFNVCSYADDDFVEATLEEGSIAFSTKGMSEPLHIIPGEQVFLNKEDGSTLMKKVNVEIFTSWKEHMLKFDNTPFGDLVKKLERWYDVDFIMDEDMKHLERYTMTIKTESLREVLSLLQLTIPIEYKIENDKVYISYSKTTK